MVCSSAQRTHRTELRSSRRWDKLALLEVSSHPLQRKDAQCGCHHEGKPATGSMALHDLGGAYRRWGKQICCSRGCPICCSEISAGGGDCANQSGNQVQHSSQGGQVLSALICETSLQ